MSGDSLKKKTEVAQVWAAASVWLKYRYCLVETEWCHDEIILWRDDLWKNELWQNEPSRLFRFFYIYSTDALVCTVCSADRTAQLTFEREFTIHCGFSFFYVVSSCFGPLVLCKIDFILHFCISCWLAAKSRWFIVLLIAPLPRFSWHSASFK